ncbi:MAG: DNA replication/repair protein RecF [Lachnospiraceae bacterium]
MKVVSLELQNYRNYETMSIIFRDGINILFGDNAQGKTNILESIYLCSTTKSHRGSKDKELIRFGQEEAHIRLSLEKKGIGHQIDMHLKKNKTKGVAINKMPIRKSSELLGMLHAVFFSPEDLRIIKNGPQERRRFVDIVLCSMDKSYLYALDQYQKVLNQRNHLLKKIIFRSDFAETLDIWDEQMITYGIEIIKKRQYFIQTINEIICEIHSSLTGGKETLSLVYEPSVKIEDYKQTILARRQKDLKLCSTAVGPHRDDINFLVNQIDIRKFGSQGQQRTAALSLKLSEIRLVEHIIQDRPILLLDDVLSELDDHRKKYLLDHIKDIQTIITCTGVEEFLESRMPIDQVYHVKEGQIESIRIKS